MRRAAALLLAALAAAAGCGPSGDLGRVRGGMNFSEVVKVMGEPRQIIRGDGVDAGRTVYVYPQGRVHFEKCEVERVVRAEEEPTITERVRELESRE